jgi:beta-glucosidase
MLDHRSAFEDQFLEGAGDVDFLAMQIYTCTRFGPDGPIAPASGGHMEYRPEALGASVRRVREVRPDTPIVITENGIDTTDDTRRVAFTEAALHGLGAAIADGADVRGYIHWSLLDNFEWFSGYGPRMGLIAVDRQTFVRTPKPSLAWLGGVARRNAL